MTADSDLSYTLHELRDYLPAGWTLSDPSDSGTWDETRGCWLVELRDIADVDWELCVDGKAAAKAGRIDALKQALDVLYREALGAPGFFG